MEEKEGITKALWSHEKHCRVCGKEIYVTPEWVYKDSWGHYCSWKCFNHRFDKSEKSDKKRAKRQQYDCKPVEQYTLDGKFVQGFSSPRKAAEAVGCSISFLRSACRYGNACYGYLWRYKENELSEMQSQSTEN